MGQNRPLLTMPSPQELGDRRGLPVDLPPFFIVPTRVAVPQPKSHNLFDWGAGSQA